MYDAVSSRTERGQMKAQPDALRELHQFRGIELVVELGLAGQDDAQHLLLGGLHAGEHAHSPRAPSATGSVPRRRSAAPCGRRRYCSIRKLFSVAMSSAFFILKGEKPNCTSTDCRKSTTETWVWLICATTTSRWISCRKDSMRVVLPAPISPVITTKPSVNQMVDSMYAFARACCLLRYRNWGSGLRRNGSSRSLNSSRYMRLVFHLDGQLTGRRSTRSDRF